MLVISAPSEPAAALAVQSGPDRLHDGSVADHHLDDQPVQAQFEAAVDHDGLLPPDCRVLASTFGTPVPPGHVALRLPAPYLDGLQRPPRAHA